MKDWDEDHVDLEWEKPKSDGGSPIQEYIIQKKEKGNLYWVNAATVPGNKTKVSTDPHVTNTALISVTLYSRNLVCNMFRLFGVL